MVAQTVFFRVGCAFGKKEVPHENGEKHQTQTLNVSGLRVLSRCSFSILLAEQFLGRKVNCRALHKIPAILVDRIGGTEINDFAVKLFVHDHVFSLEVVVRVA